jgi:ABC-type phosphonate transport system ATPase subunit
VRSTDSKLALELLRDFDAEIEGIDLASFSGERPAIYLKHRRLGIAPISVFGDAMRRSVLLAATLPTLKGGGLLLIDEVETGIHVSALGRVFSWLITSARKLGVQVLVTTHSLEALDALAAAPTTGSADDVVAFNLAQREDRTECKRFAGDLLRRLRFERGLDLR